MRSPFDPQTPDVLREATAAFFKNKPVGFEVVTQLSTNLDRTPIEDAQAVWSEEASPDRPVARLVIPAQDGFDPARADPVDGDDSFSPTHTLVAHRPFAGINPGAFGNVNRAGHVTAVGNNRPVTEPTEIEQVSA